MTWNRNLDRTWWVLRIAFAAGPFLAGLDKFLNLLTDWSMYLSPAAERILPFSGATFMHLVGVIEMTAGVLILTRFTKLAAYIVSAWLVGIALNLLATGMFFDLAVRDLEMAVAAFVLARLTIEREASQPAAMLSPIPSIIG